MSRKPQRQRRPAMCLSDIQDRDLIDTLNLMQTQELGDMFQVSGEKLLIRRDLCVETQEGHAYWIVQTGQDGGKLTEKISKYTEGKLKRSAYGQSISEAESKREKVYKKSKYRVGRENAIDPKDDPYPPPMLATPQEKTTITFPCFAQRKLDGNRCMAKVNVAKGTVEMYSRSGNFFKGLPHIENVLLDMANVSGLDEITFDGELFTLEYPFQELNGVLKLDDLNPDDYEEGSKLYEKALAIRERKAKVQFWVYDIAKKNTPQTQRTDRLQKICKQVEVVRGSIRTTADEHPIVEEPSVIVKNQEALNEFHAQSVSEGFEGTIARTMDAEYRFKKRSKGLVKIKDFQDEEFECLGMRENVKLPDTGVFICKTKEGSEFDAMPDGSMIERSKLWQHYLKDPEYFKGTLINVSFFEKYLETGVPRFPVARVRDEQ